MPDVLRICWNSIFSDGVTASAGDSNGCLRTQMGEAIGKSGQDLEINNLLNSGSKETE
jgi:hypothetical protein